MKRSRTNYNANQPEASLPSQMPILAKRSRSGASPTDLYSVPLSPLPLSSPPLLTRVSSFETPTASPCASPEERSGISTMPASSPTTPAVKFACAFFAATASKPLAQRSPERPSTADATLSFLETTEPRFARKPAQYGLNKLNSLLNTASPESRASETDPDLGLDLEQLRLSNERRSDYEQELAKYNRPDFLEPLTKHREESFTLAAAHFTLSKF